MSDEEIDVFVRDTLSLGDREFLMAVAKLVRSRSKGWTLKAAAQLVRRVAEEQGWAPGSPEEVSL